MSQKGTALLATAAPTFAAFVVIKNTWRERDNSNQEETADDASGTVNIATDDPGVDATCEWAVKAGETPLVKGDEVAETNGDERKFIVVDAETFNFGARGLRQNITLRHKTSLDAVLT